MIGMARAVHDAMVASPDAEVTNLFAGDCKGCGECCSRFLPLSEHDRRRVLDFVGVNHVAQRPTEGMLDLTCPYLVDGECAIYDARPDICRAYRCDLHANGDYAPMNALMLHRPYELCDMREIGAWR